MRLHYILRPLKSKKIWELSRQVNKLLIPLFDKAGMELVDFKLEFGKDADGNIILADEFSPITAVFGIKRPRSIWIKMSTVETSAI